MPHTTIFNLLELAAYVMVSAGVIALMMGLLISFIEYLAKPPKKKKRDGKDWQNFDTPF